MLRTCSGFVLAALLVFVACKGETETPGTPPNQFGTSSSGGSGSGSSSSGSTSGQPPPPTYVTVEEHAWSFGGRKRQFFLATPKSYAATKSYPLVVAFHGNPGVAQDMVRGYPFDPVSKEEAVIVYPSSADQGGWDIYSPTAENADMEFIKALPARVKELVNVDLARVFGFGYSGGGFFISHFKCRYAGVFKAISVNAGGGPDEEAQGYKKKSSGCFTCPGGPVPIIVTHGREDAEVEIGSGEFTAGCYAETNGCDDSVKATTPAPCELYEGCPTSAPVKRCFIPGQNHAPWGEALKEAWAFFEAQP